MSTISRLDTVLKLFGIDTVTEVERDTLMKEVLLMTLARCTNADSNIRQVEVDSVRRIYQETVGEEIEAHDVHVAARSEVYEEVPLERYLSRVHDWLSQEERVRIARALAAVIRADGRVCPPEVAFFNHIVNALHITPADLAGLDVNTDVC